MKNTKHVILKHHNFVKVFFYAISLKQEFFFCLLPDPQIRFVSMNPDLLMNIKKTNDRSCVTFSYKVAK